jgi:peroxiredoxin
VNDAFVMGAWGRDQKSTGIVRMMADGNAAYSKALGLDADFSKHGMGTRSQRYSMLVEDGVVKQLNVEQGGLRRIERRNHAVATGCKPQLAAKPATRCAHRRVDKRARAARVFI